MSSMSLEERQAFLSDLHVGIIVIPGSATQQPLAVPIWYDYTPDTGVWILTNRLSRKGVALEQAGRYGIVVQEETPPYRYVSVEGPVTEVRPSEIDGDLRPMSIRYLGERTGEAYTHMVSDVSGDDQVYVMQPERWLSADLTEELAALDR